MKHPLPQEIPSQIIHYKSSPKNLSSPNSSPREVLNTFDRLKFLGKGGYARCYGVRNVSTGATYACKIVSKSTVLNKPRNKMKLLSEIRIHRSLSHPGVVRFESCFEDGDFVYILLELCPFKTMKELLKARKTLTLFETQYYVYQMLVSLAYLHGRNIIHRDIKLGNVLLAAHMVTKLGDFGLAAQLSHSDERKSTMCGTPNYIAPEIIAHNSGGHSKSVDIWSVGVVMFALLFGYPPFETSDVKMTYKKIKFNEYTIPPRFEQENPLATDLIKRMLERDPQRRPSCGEALRHGFFGGLLGVINASPAQQPGPGLGLGLGARFAASEVQVYRAIEAVPLTASSLKEKPSLQFLVQASAGGYEKLSQNFAQQKRPRKQRNPPYAYNHNKADGDKFKIRESKAVFAGSPDILNAILADDSIQFDLALFLKKIVGIDRYIDYSAKYGFTYSLSSFLDVEKFKKIMSVGALNRMIAASGLGLGSLVSRYSEVVGCYFNDDSVMMQSGRRYMYRKSEYDEFARDGEPVAGSKATLEFGYENRPPKVQKKVKLIGYFKLMLETEENRNGKFDIFVNKVVSNKHGLVFGFNTKNYQAFFIDGSQLLVSVWESSKGRERDLYWLSYVSKEGYSVETIINLDEGMIRLEKEYAGLYRRVKYVVEEMKINRF